ncbi:MAG: YitT family protein [Bacillota bacterium]|nr:YitT family protein [Bacillota bacterium]
MLIKVKTIFSIILGTFIMALGIVWFAEPADLVTGGVSGLAIIVKDLTGGLVPIALTTAALNIPLFAISILQRGLKFTGQSLLASALFSLFLYVAEFIPIMLPTEDDLFLASVLCGIFMGAGLGIVLHAGTTTGGTDMLATIIRYSRPRFPVFYLMTVIDSVIILGGLFVFGVIKALYAVMAVAVSAAVMKAFSEGLHFAGAALIFSDKTDEISKKLMEVLERGNTVIYAKGMYTGKDKEVLLAVVSKKEVPVLRQIVMEIDDKAFMVIGEVKEVLGEGFITDYNSVTI